MTKRTYCTERFVFRRYAKGRSAAALQNASEESTDGITAIPRLRESAAMFCRFAIDENFRSSPQDELAVASLRKFSPVVVRPAVGGTFGVRTACPPCAGVLASLFAGEGR